jgi:hypothetical protein
MKYRMKASFAGAGFLPLATSVHFSGINKSSYLARQNVRAAQLGV